jgi:MOSC domain-containing protein YiiM
MYRIQFADLPILVAGSRGKFRCTVAGAMNDKKQGKLEAIWLKPVRKRAMKPVETATLVTNRGLLGNANQNGRRQVTIISQERWLEVERRLGHSADPALRRANLMVSGIELANTRGKLLRIGPALLEIWGETRPCRLMEETLPGLQSALYDDWSGGVFGIILEGGDIQVGDPVELLAGPGLTLPPTFAKRRNARPPAQLPLPLNDARSES